MKIKYKKKRFTQNLTFSIIWTVLGFLNLQYSDNNNWTDYGYLFVALLYWFGYVMEKRNQYLTVDNESIKENSPFGKKINLSEISWIKKYAGDYILKTNREKMKIHTEIIDENSLAHLNRTLQKLNLPPDKTPFGNRV